MDDGQNAERRSTVSVDCKREEQEASKLASYSIVHSTMYQRPVQEAQRAGGSDEESVQAFLGSINY